MPNRIIREGHLDSKAVDALSEQAENFYSRLRLVVDDYGRFECDPVILLAKTYPRRVARYCVGQIESWLIECDNAELVSFYRVKGKDYLQVENFRQRVRASKYPEPKESDEVFSLFDSHVTVIGQTVAGLACASNTNTTTHTPPNTNTQEGGMEETVFEDSEQLSEQSTDLDDFSVDTIAEVFHTEWANRFGAVRAVYGKDKQCIEQWALPLGTVENLRKELDETYAREPHISLSEFIKSRRRPATKNRNSLGHAQRGSGLIVSGRQVSNGWHGKSNGHSPPKEAYLSLPKEALDWNVKIPKAEVKAWTKPLDEFLTDALCSTVFVENYSIWLERCQKWANAEPQKANMSHCLKFWKAVVNGERNFIWEKKSDGHNGQSQNQSVIQRALELAKGK